MNKNENEDIGPLGITLMLAIFLLAVFGAGAAVSSFGGTTTSLSHEKGIVIKSKKSWWGLRTTSTQYKYDGIEWNILTEEGKLLKIPKEDTQIQ